MMMGYARQSRADCDSGTAATVTCTGDIGAGGTGVFNGGIYFFETGTSTINVQDLDADISPSPGIPGITLYTYEQDATVIVDTDKSITTNGNTGIYVGTYGYDASGNVSVTSNSNIATTGGGASGIAASTYSKYDDAGNITVNNSGVITTDGNSSHGIYARTGTDTGYVGDIDIDNSGDITTTGDFSHGINATAVKAFFGYNRITIDNSGDITTTGRSSFGIRASGGDVTIDNSGDIRSTGQSGAGISAFGNSVVVTTTGDVSATGQDGVGIYAGASGFGKRDAKVADGTVTINVDAGSVQGGAGGFGAGIRLGRGSHEVNIAAGASVEALSGVAIAGQAGALPVGKAPAYAYSTTINNAGTVIGNVELSEALVPADAFGRTTTFNNLAGGVFAPGDTVGLGSNGTLNNAGDLSPGGEGAIQKTALTGSLVQTSTGTMTVDVDGSAGTSDKVTVTGTADLGGKVVPIVKGNVTDGQQFTIATADGGTTNSGVTVTDTVGFDFEVLFKGNDVVLSVEDALTVLQALDQLGSSNQNEVAGYLDNLRDGGASEELLELINGLLSLPDQASLAAALDRLIPSNMTGQLDSTLLANLSFGNKVLSCGVDDGSPNAVIKEGQCLWAKVTGRTFDHDRTSGTLGFDERAGGIAAGIQFALPGEWRLGFALDYEKSETKTNGLSETEGDKLQGAVVVKQRWGNTGAAVVVSGGYGWLDTDRYISTPTLLATATSEQQVRHIGAKLRLHHIIPMMGWYLKPMVDFTATRVHVDGFRETGAGAASLVVGDLKETVLGASPAVEIGTEFYYGGALLRPWARVGGTFFNDNESTVTATFAGAPAGVAPFTFTSALDDKFFDVATGLNLLMDGYELRLNYDGRFSGNTSQHLGGAKLSVKF